MAKSDSIESGIPAPRKWSFVTALAVCGLAISSWLSVSGLWVELPLLVTSLPEGWKLPSYMVIAIQIANVGPIIYGVTTFLFPKMMKGHRGENIAIWAIIFIGMVATVLLRYYWDHTTIVNGDEHSTYMLLLTVVLAFVDCTSTVVFLPFMASFPTRYMTAFYVGEGLSGLIPGLAGIAQGVGDMECVNYTTTTLNNATGFNETTFQIWPVYDPPNYSIESFFWFMFGCVCVSGIAFLAILYVPECVAERNSGGGSGLLENSSISSEGAAYAADLDDTDRKSNGSFTVVKERILTPSQNPLPFKQFVYLMVIIAIINGLTNGILPSFQTYAAQPYGHRAYSWSVRLSIIANPVACFVAFFVCIRSMLAFTLLTGLGMVFSAYAIMCAFGSPVPVLADSALGGPFIVISFVMIFAILSYLKVAIASLLADRGGSRALFWCGVITQVGGCVSAILGYLLVNTWDTLKPPQYC